MPTYYTYMYTKQKYTLYTISNLVYTRRLGTTAHYDRELSHSLWVSSETDVMDALVILRYIDVVTCERLSSLYVHGQ